MYENLSMTLSILLARKPLLEEGIRNKLRSLEGIRFLNFILVHTVIHLI